MPLRRLRREDYTVGWVCALPIELAAAQEMLDEEHDQLEYSAADENLYSFGSINGHNVVIGCLPAGRIGNNSAAVVATQMRATFRWIRFGLMVGIGGGVPCLEADIRLGDIVVSQPNETFGGVVQWDIGKQTTSGFIRTESLNAPPQLLLNAVSKVRANEARGKSKLVEFDWGKKRLQEQRKGCDVVSSTDELTRTRGGVEKRAIPSGIVSDDISASQPRRDRAITLVVAQVMV
ncbi:MAG: hypothetical protein Q9160_001565 [Pyrenula sp. 1 TL-2023]